MADPVIWKNVAVKMQSAIATAQVITSISKANPGVVGLTGHGYSDGDIIYLETLGMYQCNEKVARVASSATDTFALEGIDTTDFDDFSSGTVAKVTLGTSVTSATTVNASGGEYDFIDYTTIHVNARQEMPGLPSAIKYSMDHLWDITDAAQAAMKAASDVQAKRVVSFQFGSGGKMMYFAGYVGFAGNPVGSAQGLVTASGVFTLGVSPTYYSS